MADYIFERYEKKYLINQKQLEILLPEFLKHMQYDSHCLNNHKYNIYNLYFDTNNDDIVRTCILEPTYKEKLRIRSYSIPQSKDSEIFLEIKRKCKGKGSKRRIKMTIAEAEKFTESLSILPRSSYFDKQILNEFTYYLKTNQVQPVVFLSYERLAFIGDNDLRITVDSNLKTRRENVNLFDTNGTQILDDNTFIMEIKIPNSIPLWLVKLLSDLKIYSRGFSKYGYDYKRKTKQINIDFKGEIYG